ncbi:hypothetical protein L204_101786 [Cryptococcus depauperatus]|nr:oligosaccharyltransferase complex subunit gamma [Cryptococcus depauperatus CBS 7855]
MRLFPLLSLLGLPLASTAAKVPDWPSLAAKARDGAIKLNTQSYHDLLALDREYSVTILLTALPAQFKCEPCRQFDPAFSHVSDSWARLPKAQRDQHFFARLDFADGQEIYSQLGLSSAPTVMYHPPMAGPKRNNKLSVITYDIKRHGLDASALHNWVSNLTPTHFDLHEPFNPMPYIVIPASIIAIAVFVYSLRSFLVPLAQSRVVWGCVSLILILTFISGYMWNRIRNAPYIAMGKDGKINWIAGGYQNQLGLESQVVGGIYGLLAFCIIALTLFVPAQTSPVKQRIGVYLWLGMLVVVFSLLIKLFKLKNGGYPFSLLF